MNKKEAKQLDLMSDNSGTNYDQNGNRQSSTEQPQQPKWKNTGVTSVQTVDGIMKKFQDKFHKELNIKKRKIVNQYCDQTPADHYDVLTAQEEKYEIARKGADEERKKVLEGQ